MKIKDWTLTSLIGLQCLNIITLICGVADNRIRYLFLFFTFIVILFENKNRTLPILFFLHPNSALYDEIGFKYLFNVSILICVIKLLFQYKWKINKKLLSILIVLTCYDIALTILYKMFNHMSLAILSWFLSYILLILYATHQEELNLNEVYHYFLIGYILAFIYGAIQVYQYFGSSIPQGYRFVGLLRDANPYSVDALILIFSVGLYEKNTIKKIIIIGIITIMGLLSVSKTYILLLFVGLILCGALDIYKRKIKINKILLIILVVFALGIILLSTKYFEFFMNKYLFRMKRIKLFTGRDYIQGYYVKEIIQKPERLLFGTGSSYNYLSDIGKEEGKSFYINKQAHNTYLDIILSWGVLGRIIIYYFLMYDIFRS